MSKATRIKGEFNGILGHRVPSTDAQMARQRRIFCRTDRVAGFTPVRKTSNNIATRAMKRAVNSDIKQAKREIPEKVNAGLQGYQFIMGVLSRGCNVGAA